MDEVSDYAIVETPFSHEPGETGNHISTLLYRSGCSHVPTIDLGTGNPSVTAFTLTTAKSGLATASDARYLTCVWALSRITANGNNITSLDVSANTALTYLTCNTNELTSLDVSTNTALIYLTCSINEITSLDVSTNTLLENLSCYINNLTSFDVTNNPNLTSLSCRTNLFNDAAIDAFIAGMDSIAWTVEARTLDISVMPNASDINTGTTCASLGNLAAEGWVITYEQGNCTV